MRTKDSRLHFSELKRIGTMSPKHYKHFTENPEGDSKEYKLGRALHRKWLLGIDSLVYDGRRDSRTKAYQQFLEECGADESEVLIDSEWTRVLGMCRALDSHPASSRLRAQCELFEREMSWERSGVECFGTLDMSTRRHGVICDLKSCESARPETFQRRASRYGYDCQLAWYSRAFGDSNDWPECYIIAVESNAPFDVVVHRASPLLLDLADKQIDEWIVAWKSCSASGVWPGYADDIVVWNVDPDKISVTEDD